MNASPPRFLAVAAATVLTVPLLLSAAPATARAHTPAEDAADFSQKLVHAASARGAHRHLEKFQAIADSADGNRAAGSPGHDASAAYVYTQLKDAGYQVSYDTFDFTYIETLAEKLSVTAPTPREVEIAAMSYTKSTPEGGLKAALAPVPADATTGCEPADYAAKGFTGKIALIQRGGCDFAQKQKQAAAAGAVGAIIHNNASGALNGTLGGPDAAVIPTGGITQAEGKALTAEAAKGAVTVSMDVRQLQEKRTTRNVVAETRAGAPARTVMLGSHLDSVTDGPGMNDNASGSAGLLEVALQLAKSHEKPTNKVRFAWWSAEELGLLGSKAYVKDLTPQQRADIALYLNFDMIASPNHAEFVYDGDNSDATGSGPGPEGSAQLEKDINDFLDSNKVPHEGTDFDGRSDYGPFIDAGIPSGGTFTGAEGVKSEAQAKRYGGTAGTAYDACYHAACDDLSNISGTAFDINIDVIADAVGTYAHHLGALKKQTTAARPTRDTAVHSAGHEPAS